MVRLWLRWSLRDLRHRWLLVTSIALTIALGTGTYAALSGTMQWRLESNDASFSLTHLHDVRLALSPGTSAHQGALTELLATLPSYAGVAKARERLLVPTQVRVGTEAVPATVVGHAQPQGDSVDSLWLTAGSGPDGAQVVLEQKFAKAHALGPYGTLELPGGRRLTYQGLGTAPEEFIVTGRDATAFLGEGGFATVYATLTTAQSLSPALAGRVNDLVLTLRPGTSRAAVVAQLRAALGTRGLSGEVTTRNEVPAHRILYQDAHNDDQFWTVVAGLVLLGATFAAANLTTRVVEAQRREIGVGMALGLRPPALALRPLLLGLQIALVGSVLGVVVALVLTAPLATLYRTLLPLPVWRTGLQLAPYVSALVAGTVLPLVAVAVPVRRAVRVEPVEAIRTGSFGARSSWLLGRSRWLRLPGRGYRSLPLRNLVRRPRRTLLTALAVAASVTTLVAIGGLLDSFRASLHTGEQELSRMAPERLTVSLDSWYPPTAPQVSAVTRLSGVARAALGLQVPATATAGNRSLALLVTVLPDDSPWRPSVWEGSGRGEARNSGIVLAAKAVRDLGVSPGGTVTLRYPRPAATGAQLVTAQVHVVGVHPNPLRVLAYLDTSTARQLGLAGVVSTVQLLPRAGVTQDQLRASLFGIASVATVEDSTSAARALDEALRQFVGILLVMAGAVLVLALLIAYNSSTISVDERAREHATMKAFGLPGGSLVGMLMMESLVIGVLGSLAGLAGGLLVIDWMVSSLLATTVPDFEVAPHIGPQTVLAVVVVGVVAVALAPLLTARRIRRLDVPSTLRVVE